MPEGVLGKVPEEAHEETPAKTSVEVCEETPAKISAEVREETPAKVHGEAHRETPAKVPEMVSLASPRATREVLDRHGLSAKYSFGQNFLVNDAIVRKIIALANVEPSDDILEVGPGIGTLTRALLQHARSVLAIECDTDLLPVLGETTAAWADRFSLINMDACAFDPCLINGEVLPSKLVSNLPYAVAATIVLDYFERFDWLQSATVMVQREVADRMAAKPGSKNYGAYTVKLSLFAQPAGRFAVGPGNFLPAPRVESAVLRLNRAEVTDENGVPLSPEQKKAVCVMADAAFANRRKTIANSCKSYFSHDASLGAEALMGVLADAGIDARRRGETLTLQEFIKLGLRYYDACAVHA